MKFLPPENIMEIAKDTISKEEKRTGFEFTIIPEESGSNISNNFGTIQVEVKIEKQFNGFSIYKLETLLLYNNTLKNGKVGENLSTLKIFYRTEKGLEYSHEVVCYEFPTKDNIMKYFNSTKFENDFSALVVNKNIFESIIKDNIARSMSLDNQLKQIIE